MADYTYTELMKMQNDAIKRAEDMQRRARQSAGFDKSDSGGKSPPPDAPRHIYQSGYLTSALQGETPLEKENHGYKNTNFPTVDKHTDNFLEKIKGGFSDINIDSDKALLLSLIMLLSEENADELLIMALIYMLN